MKPLIAWKTLGDLNIASSRLRAFLPCKYLTQEGWPCEMFAHQNLHQYKLVIFQKLYNEDSIDLAKTLKSKGVKTVFDLCDNHFYYDLDNPLASHERAERIHRMVDLVDIVSVSTQEMRSLIHSQTGRDPIVIDDAVEPPPGEIRLELYSTLRNFLIRRRDKSFRIVWYGNAGSKNPPFGMIDLLKVLPFLEKLHRKLPVTLTVISNSMALFEEYTKGVSFPGRYYPWDRSTFPYLFRQHDVFIIPISINPITICKTNNRLVQSLLLGVPAVADRIPSYEEFSNFVLFSDWENNLYKYAVNSELRRQHVNQANVYIKSKYNKSRVVAQWSSLFASLLDLEAERRRAS